MSDEATFLATFTDSRLVKGRKVCQLIFEVPVEAADKALAILGGIPNPEHSAWVGIARITEPKKKNSPKLTGKDIWRASAECARLCTEPRFQHFMGIPRGSNAEMETAAAVRAYCEVDSRGELDRNSHAAILWQGLKQKYEMRLSR